jgi:hypothetical protein
MAVPGRRDFSAAWQFSPASVFGLHLKLSDVIGAFLL